MALLRVSEKDNPSFLARAVSASHWGILSKTWMRFIHMIIAWSYVYNKPISRIKVA